MAFASRTLRVNGLDLHVVVEGQGPDVLVGLYTSAARVFPSRMGIATVVLVDAALAGLLKPTAVASKKMAANTCRQRSPTTRSSTIRLSTFDSRPICDDIVKY